MRKRERKEEERERGEIQSKRRGNGGVRRRVGEEGGEVVERCRCEHSVRSEGSWEGQEQQRRGSYGMVGKGGGAKSM